MKVKIEIKNRFTCKILFEFETENNTILKTLKEAIMRDANLSGADLRGADLRGAAFQKINFLRDMNSDLQERGRVYFPGIDLTHFNESTKQEILKDIQIDFDEALIGIKLLPKGARRGVHLAYVYYLNLFQNIRKASIEKILQERIRVSDKRKAYLLMNTMVKNQFNLL